MPKHAFLGDWGCGEARFEKTSGERTGHLTAINAKICVIRCLGSAEASFEKTSGETIGLLPANNAKICLFR